MDMLKLETKKHKIHTSMHSCSLPSALYNSMGIGKALQIRIRHRRMPFLGVVVQ
jgi:hypothetical protein